MKLPRRPRELRKPFVAAIVITEIISERKMSSRTSDLSVHGCSVLTPTPLNPGVKVRIAIVHADAKVVTFGHVVSVRPDGMSISFDKTEQRDQAVLERWISRLRVN